MERKIKSNIASKRSLHAKGKGPPVDEVAVVNNIHDSLRYTMLIPYEKYSATVKSTREKLLNSGNTKMKFKNYWQPGICNS